MIKNLALLTTLLVIPRLVPADAASSPNVSSDSPCTEAESTRFRATIFAKADAPNSLWHLIAYSVCPTYTQAASAAVRQHLPRSIPYIDKSYDAEGRVVRTDRLAPPREAAKIISADSEPTYAGLWIEGRRSATLEVSNLVCTMTLQAAHKDGKWVVRGLTTFCE